MKVPRMLGEGGGGDGGCNGGYGVLKGDIVRHLTKVEVAIR